MMTLIDKVRTVLAASDVPTGYVVQASEDGSSVQVEYPKGRGGADYWAVELRPDSVPLWRPGPDVVLCAEVLARAFAIEIVPAVLRHHVRVVGRVPAYL
jgi:hypothetical protein